MNNSTAPDTCFDALYRYGVPRSKLENIKKKN